MPVFIYGEWTQYFDCFIHEYSFDVGFTAQSRLFDFITLHPLTIWSPVDCASIQIMIVDSEITGLFRRMSAEMWLRTKLSSLPHKPNISHLKGSNDITCASLEIIFNQRSVPMLP
jgi:hypothetical protein